MWFIITIVVLVLTPHVYGTWKVAQRPPWPMKPPCYLLVIHHLVLCNAMYGMIDEQRRQPL